jgi:hypothetical protein
MDTRWTKEMTEEYIEFMDGACDDKLDLFPCSTLEAGRTGMTQMMGLFTGESWKSFPHRVLYLALDGGRFLPHTRVLICDFAEAVISDEKSAWDHFGRCQLQCANCNCRMLFKQLECVKADLESTKETLQLTSEELHSTKEALEECKAESAEEKRKFTGAIAKMVEREMGDVRTQLNALKDGVPPFFVTMALSKKAASEAAKAALSASKHITLRLLMF